MPRFDGTGPQGSGPMSGYGRGYCMNYIDSSAPAAGWTGIYGCGFGRGRNRRYWYHAAVSSHWNRWGPERTISPAAFSPPFIGKRGEMEYLEKQVLYMEKALEETKKRIKELEESKESKEINKTE